MSANTYLKSNFPAHIVSVSKNYSGYFFLLIFLFLGCFRKANSKRSKPVYKRTLVLEERSQAALEMNTLITLVTSHEILQKSFFFFFFLNTDHIYMVQDEGSVNKTTTCWGMSEIILFE